MLTRRTIIASAAPVAASCIFGMPALVRAAPTRSIGLTLPLTGVQASVGKEMKEAYEMAMELSSSPFKLKILDDESKAEAAAVNMQSLSSDSTVIAVSGIVGTPHAQACAPIAAKAGLPVIGIRSGARSLRTQDNTIWHLRATFEDEITYIVKDAAGRGNGGIIVVFSDDSFGKSSKDWMHSEMKRLGVKEILTISVDRDGTQVPDVCTKISASLKGLAEMPSIALLMITKPMVAATKELRTKHKIVGPILAMSFTANTAVTSEQDPGLVGLGVITAFPLPRSSMSSGPTRFRKEIALVNKPHLADSLTAYEAWFYGKTLAALSGVEKREEVISRISRRLSLPDVEENIAFDSTKVGFHYLGMAYKSFTGKLRAL